MRKIKMKEYLLRLLLSGLAVFAPIKGVLITTGILIFADLVFGVIAAHKRGEKITSSGLRRTITKMFVYQTTLLIGYLAEIYLLDKVLPVTKLISGMIGVVELKSILESMDTINGQPLFKNLIARLGSQNDNILNKKQD